MKGKTRAYVFWQRGMLASGGQVVFFRNEWDSKDAYQHFTMSAVVVYIVRMSILVKFDEAKTRKPIYKIEFNYFFKYPDFITDPCPIKKFQRKLRVAMVFPLSVVLSRFP